LNAVRKRGYLTDVQVPYEGEGGWHFAITIDGQIFGIFILWTAFGHPESHYFSIQVSLDRGVFAAMFRRDVRDERLEPVRRALEDVSGSVPLLSEFRWLTSAQFTSIE
jgi:hypothetical protein